MDDRSRKALSMVSFSMDYFLIFLGEKYVCHSYTYRYLYGYTYLIHFTGSHSFTHLTAYHTERTGSPFSRCLAINPLSICLETFAIALLTEPPISLLSHPLTVLPPISFVEPLIYLQKPTVSHPLFSTVRTALPSHFQPLISLLSHPSDSILLLQPLIFDMKPIFYLCNRLSD